MKRISITFIMAISLAASVHAQEVLTLDRCYSMALENNKELKSAKVTLEKTGYDKKSAKSLFFPDISLVAGDMYGFGSNTLTIPGGKLPIYTLDPSTGTYVPNVTPNPDGSYTMNQYADFPDMKIKYEINNVFMGGIMLKQPIYMGGKITSAYKMSKIGEQIASQNVRLTESEVIVETDNAFINAVKAKEMCKVAGKYNEMLTELLKNVEGAYKHGMKTKNDVLKVQVKQNESILMMQKAQNAFKLAKMNLCHIIGMDMETDIDVAYDNMITENAATVGGDISARPEHEILSNKVELAKQNIAFTRSDFLPNIALSGGFAYANGVKIAGNKLMDNTTGSVMLTLNIPVFHFGEGINKVKAAKAEHQIAMLEQSNLNEKMELELAQARNNLEESEIEMEITQKSLKQAEENMKMSKQQYEVGMELLTNYLEAQSIWQQAYADEINARCSHFIATSKYLKASGLLDKSITEKRQNSN